MKIEIDTKETVELVRTVGELNNLFRSIKLLNETNNIELELRIRFE